MKPEQLEIELLRREISLAASDRLQCHITSSSQASAGTMGPERPSSTQAQMNPWILAAHALWAFHQSQEDLRPAVGCIDSEQRSQALGVNAFSDNPGLAIVDFDGDFVGDA